MSSMTPQEIVSELDRFIIGQTVTKRAVAIALRNRWRHQQRTRAEDAGEDRILDILIDSAAPQHGHRAGGDGRRGAPDLSQEAARGPSGRPGD